MHVCIQLQEELYENVKNKIQLKEQITAISYEFFVFGDIEKMIYSL